MRFLPKHKHYQWLMYFLGTTAIFSQNLVNNPSFERFVKCPERLGNFNIDVESWSTPTEGSTDYFNRCSSAMGTPENFNGNQPADFGEGYSGLYLYAPDDYREYLQAELLEPLKKGKNYLVSFYVSLAERSDFAIKEFGIVFAHDPLHIPINKVLSKNLLYQKKDNTYTPLEIGYTNFYSDTQDWILVNTQFIAKGSEKYMILGNFKNNARTRLFKKKRNAKQGAYYYVDMISVKPVDSTDIPGNQQTTEGLQQTFELDKTHVFENLLFEFDRYQLLETAKNELVLINEYLKANSGFQIMISGHTDSLGSEDYNESLSLRRAEAVVKYFQKIGLSKDRMTWQG
ncbi:MAG: OmpA family protein, partial [Pricia sp.]|nr:OmpA family protein [Pricia sp.]